MKQKAFALPTTIVFMLLTSMLYLSLLRLVTGDRVNHARLQEAYRIGIQAEMAASHLQAAYQDSFVELEEAVRNRSELLKERRLQPYLHWESWLDDFEAGVFFEENQEQEQVLLYTQELFLADEERWQEVASWINLPVHGYMKAAYQIELVSPNAYLDSLKQLRQDLENSDFQLIKEDLFWEKQYWQAPINELSLTYNSGLTYQYNRRGQGSIVHQNHSGTFKQEVSQTLPGVDYYVQLTVYLYQRPKAEESNLSEIY
ncbi:hypothetical protein CL176_03570 [Suicoccus acidiformans]|uniref:Uncharacterized protein n=1 Tax=Suicoccus acidiformans TaxID=2036206 RepID=A0A347WJC7_9LACT|nr:hypothetical protein [Suicoccus acidiformans]AXY25184.1 hypothetical protein CL176_03570 [Suicoccus acidiformans]